MADPASNSPSQQSKSESRSHKGDATQAPDRPPRPSRSAEGQAAENPGSPGFTEDQTKDVTVSSGGGLAQTPELTEEDPDHELRGEDQLVDGVSEVVEPGEPEGKQASVPDARRRPAQRL